MSRLLPTAELEDFFTIDPWEIDPSIPTEFVELVERKTHKSLAVDWQNRIVARRQRILELVNTVNNQSNITCQKVNEIDGSNCERRLRPILVSRFTTDYRTHGRLYTVGRGGHQSLRKIERATIKFDGEPSVELDYSGLHPRLLYHEEGNEFGTDPYALWGTDTTRQHRLLAKKLVNAAINARSSNAAISACNMLTCPKDKNGEWKTGKDREEARRMQAARKKTGLAFKDIYSLALKFHQPIAHHFGKDAGMRLMKLDSGVAINICQHFAEMCVPCLPVHDSFIVPESAETELFRVMNHFYRLKTDFLPVIKSAR